MVESERYTGDIGSRMFIYKNCKIGSFFHIRSLPHCEFAWVAHGLNYMQRISYILAGNIIFNHLYIKSKIRARTREYIMIYLNIDKYKNYIREKGKKNK